MSKIVVDLIRDLIAASAEELRADLDGGSTSYENERTLALLVIADQLRHLSAGVDKLVATISLVNGSKEVAP